jgi:hypothetical protein
VRLRFRWEDKKPIQMDVKETEVRMRSVFIRISGGDQLRAVVNTAMNLPVP